MPFLFVDQIGALVPQTNATQESGAGRTMIVLGNEGNR